MGPSLALILTGLVVATAQPALSGSLSVAGVKPDVALIFIVSIGLILGPRKGMWAGFGCGLIGAISAADVGFGALVTSRLLVGPLAGYAGTRLFPGNPLVPPFALGAFTWVCEIIYFAVSPQPHLAHWARICLIESAYNAMLSWPMYFWVSLWASRGTRLREWART